MPTARNQEVTVRRPLAKRAPSSSRGRRAAERFCSQWARAAKALVRQGGRCENDMAGSWTRDALNQSHGVQGASVWPPPADLHASTPSRLLSPPAIFPGGKMAGKFSQRTVGEQPPE